MLRTMPLRHKLESLYNCYLDSRAAASRNSRVVSDDPEHKLAALLGAGGPLLTRAELRDELERCLSETKVDAATDTPFPNPEKAAAGPYTGVDMSAGKSRTVVSILKLDPPEGTTREQMAAALTTPIEPKREPLNRGPWAADLAEQDRRHEELLAAARDLASIDPTNTLLDQPGLLPAHELKLARLRHALAQAARETAGSRTACANRWLSIAATLGIDPGKNPPDDIAGFIDNGGKEALTQQIVREQWKGKGLAQVLFELMIPRRTEPAR